MKAKDITVALAISILAGVLIHFVRLIFSPRGRVISQGIPDASSLQSLPVAQYMDAIAKHEREMTFLESLSYQLDADVLLFYLPNIGLNILVVFLAIQAFIWAKSKSI